MIRECLVVAIFFFSCNEGTENAVKPSTDKGKLSQRELDELVDRAINNGDEDSYHKVHSYYSLAGRGDLFLYDAMVMAHKYNYANAYLDVYWIFAQHRNGKSLRVQDNRTKSLALYYLLKSKELGCEEAKYAVEDFFGKDSVPPSSDYYLKALAND